DEAAIALHGARPLPGRIHTIRGSDPSGWRTGLQSFAEVIARGVYPGIDVLYKGRDGRLEYDFLLAPGADPDRIRLRFEGITDLALTAQGDLLLHTPFGTLRQPRPVIYQLQGGRRVPLQGGYRLLPDNRIGFEVSAYRPDLPLIIDPLLELATTLGGSAADSGKAIAIDANGDIYIAGITRSADMPVAGALQPDANGGYDLFIGKYDAAFNPLYLTYLGGSGNDGVLGSEPQLALAVDAFGQVVIGGATTSRDLPLVAALQPQPGGRSDGFIAKLSADGSRLLFATYLGGRRDDAVTALAIDAEGTIHVAGHTRSDDFPTRDPLQPTSAGKQDAFVVTLSADGRQLLRATYLGGSGTDRATAIAVAADGALYLTGLTRSQRDFPLVHARQSDFGGGKADAFLAKLAADGSQWEWVSYLGGAGHDTAYGLTLDGEGRLLVSGETGSRDFPTRNPIQSGLRGKSDGFIARFLDDGSLDYATWLGGSKQERFNAIAVDRHGRIHVTGHSRSHDFPLVDALQPRHGGKADIVIVQLSEEGQIQFSSLLGGRKEDIGAALVVDRRGAVTVTGSTRSRLDFPQVSPLQPGFQGAQDAFLLHILPDNRPPRINSEPITTGRVGRRYHYQVQAEDDDGDPLRFALTEAPQAMQIDADSGRVDWMPEQAGSFRITISVSDGQGGAESQSFELQIAANRPPQITSQPLASGRAGQSYRYAVEATDPDGDPLSWYLTTAPPGMTIDPDGIIDWLPQLAGHYPVTVTVRDDLQGVAEQRFTLIIDRINQPPVLQPIAPQTIPLGTTLILQLDAEDSDNDPLTYSVTPLPLPPGAELDAATGRFRFRPERPGSHPLTFAVSDGYAADRQTVTITVTAPDANADTTFSGRVLDANAAAEGITTPIAGVIVSFLDTGRSAVTDAQGYFTLTGLPGGDQVLDIDPTTAAAPDGNPYAGFRERYRLAEHAANEEARPFYLPRIAAASLTPVDPTQTTEVQNDNLQITLSVPPHTAKNPDGSDFTGQLSIS
ncbi:MAG TPA: hypothetical protein EYP90_14600, partial [Chromatiaceae bacterium]|nr:hypothetical protein [Chromatiaceae bacterium]